MLWVRVGAPYLGIVIKNHNALAIYEDLIPILEEKQQEAIDHFEKTNHSTLENVEESIRDR